MRIIDKHRIETYGPNSVMEGTVARNKGGEVQRWWVEDQQGNRKSDFTDADTATSIAQALSEPADSEGSEGSDGGHSSDSGDSGGDSGGNGGD